MDVISGSWLWSEEQVKTVRENAALYTAEELLDPSAAQQLLEHPINYLVERMTISYLESHGGEVTKSGESLISNRGQEKEKYDHAFAARRGAIARIGLPQVREYRLELLRQEEQAWYEQLRQAAQSTPELVPLLLVHIRDV